MRFMTMADMTTEAQMSRFTIMPALQTGELHGTQRKKYGTWRVEEGCFRAWMLGEKCEHRKGVAA